MPHPLFLVFLVQELTDAPDDVVAFVGHLRVEVDVRDASFLGVHPRNQVLHVAIVAMAFAEHHHAFDAAQFVPIRLCRPGAGASCRVGTRRWRSLRCRSPARFP